MTITAKVVVSGRTELTDQVTLVFSADYADERNKEWALYTPALSLSMTVKSEVAEHFPQGQSFTLTFEPEELRTQDGLS